MQYSVIFTPKAREQLIVLYEYIAAAASPEIAERISALSSRIAKVCKTSRIVVRAAMTYAMDYVSRTIKSELSLPSL